MVRMVSFALMMVRIIRAPVTISRIAVVCLACVGTTSDVCGQFNDGSARAYTMFPSRSPLADSSLRGEAFAEPALSPRRGVLARLVKNPQLSGGLPPFALTDQAGTIQRYVEPVEGTDLDPYLGQVVVVRHDTGRTLLASQLELPQQLLLPLVDERALAQGPADRDPIQPVQFADGNDATVELLPENAVTPQSADADKTRELKDPSDSISLQGDAIESRDESTGPTMPPMTVLGDASSLHGTIGNEELPSEWDFVEPCPQCDGYHVTPECNLEFGGHLGPWGQEKSPRSRLFMDVEFNFFRTHIVDNPLGKLSEKYEFSPRVSLGFRDTGNLDGRARYWSYDHDTRTLSGSTINVQFDVLDLEGIHLFLGRRSELQLASGLRLASIDLSEGGTTAGADLLGITVAADGRTCLCEFQDGLFTWVYGGRLSVLGGDWGGEAGNPFVTGRTQDDNVIVHELHAGIDYAICHGDFDLHTRLGFEMQNWHSDALAQTSIGIIGPNFLFGAEF
jgi:hypothetical protein